MKKVIFGGGYTDSFGKVRMSIQVIDLHRLTTNTLKVTDFDSLTRCCKKSCNDLDVIQLLQQSYILSNSLAKLASLFNMHWIENITTIYFEKNGIEFAQCYLGGYFTDNTGLKRPIGYASGDFQDLISQFKNLLWKMKSLSKISLLSINEKEIILDCFSSGLVFHEMIGHPSEQDVMKLDNGSFKPSLFLKELHAIDRPFSGQRYDDFGYKMKPQNLMSGFLGVRSGNCFLSFTKDKIKKPLLLIRQRCLSVNFNLHGQYRKANAIIFGGRYIPEKRAIQLDILLGGLGTTVLLIPLSDIQCMFGIDNNKINYYTICKKQGVPVVVGLNAPACCITLKYRIKEYMQGKLMR